MYEVDFVKPAGQGWYEVRLKGPRGLSIPMRQWKRDATEDDVFKAAFDRCHRLNVFHGYVKPKEKQALYRSAYRNWATVRLDASKRLKNKWP